MDEVDSLYRDALEWYEREQFARAAVAFERLLARDPSHVEARYKLANALKEQGDWDSAARHYESLLRLVPGHAEALNNLGAAHQYLDRPQDAERCYRQAIALRPALAQPYLNLGRLLQAAGRDGEACAVFRAALDRGLDAGVFGHLLRASSGEAAAKAPEAYVRETFDAFAAQFDRHLVDTLDYRVPQELARWAVRHFGSRNIDVLDLGCGTGLVGESLKPWCNLLVGVDLSHRMLEAARRRGCYDELHAAELEQWLGQAPAARFDLAVAADVFIYIGSLDKVFALLQKTLRPEGVMAFSVESCEGDEWRLLASGRYAQSASYVRRLSERHGFQVERCTSTSIRRGVPGELYALVKKR
ncbi:MAG: hypothetical protein A2W04_05335 [Betaproteobacteria bacterium RBG_16_64_9]|nr:MAG: hypothetical protein A2W04_05335 [Betaproteobacteria bacterium RBG_16_64_9]OGA30131.1 MAG: hypothetical protein A3I01_02945 [Betaproteobacteria bacterium RIFCSPLOWO2_02_FULL_65_24]OGA95089.1 MAG: hypothetical protein A3G27_19960 [Betaproteobacteria bacterium RIFCSPLOWO2_12_FULL_66_14]